MCTRGLLLLMHNKSLNKYPELVVEITETFIEVVGSSSTDLVMQHLTAMPKPEFHQYIIQLQSLLTIHIVSGELLNMNLVKSCVKMLDIFYRVNFKVRAPTDQILEKEFINQAVNNDVVLDPSISAW